MILKHDTDILHSLYLLQETSPTTVTVQITPPENPNGVVRYYNVLANNTVVSSYSAKFAHCGKKTL